MGRDRFFNWLARKYGYGKERYAEIEREEPEFAESLFREFASIACEV